jgi:pantoate--beta-alanine ligase
MEIIRRPHLMQQMALSLKRDKFKIAFVPTMGYLHSGHLSLVRRANQLGQVTVVSIFVNPTQFGPEEDYEEYPRDLARDAEMLKDLDVDVLFAPDATDLFPEGFSTTIENPSWGALLCGRSRPGHFRGVTTVVGKLFHLVFPDFAVFGQKDFQQCAIIKRMVLDLNFPMEIVVCPTVRESDGLAMSSRNVYLNPDERKAALVLHRSLQHIETLVGNGEHHGEKLTQALAELVGREPLARLDYAQVVDAATLEPLEKVDRKAAVLLAVHLGKTRLIDNVLLDPKGE